MSGDVAPGPDGIDAVVLAAGSGSRMGRIKPLVPLNGEPVLEIVLRRLRDAGLPSPIVVLGDDADRIRQAIDLSHARVIVNDHPARGMSTSLALGLTAVSEGARGALIFHADMPFLTARTIRKIISTARTGARIAAPVYRGTRGFPVYLARSCFREVVATLVGDAGARGYLAAHAGDISSMEVDDAGCVVDIDRPEDLAFYQGVTSWTTSE
jgi:CTP:molybdopterin cytidylyltransferase MocA